MGMPNIVNLTLTNANTEYSIDLTGISGLAVIQARTAVDVRLALTTGIVATPSGTYFTIKSGSSLTIDTNKNTLFFASGTAGAVVEVITQQ